MASWYDDGPAAHSRGRGRSIGRHRKTVGYEMGDEAVGLDVCGDAEGVGAGFEELGANVRLRLNANQSGLTKILSVGSAAARRPAA